MKKILLRQWLAVGDVVVSTSLPKSIHAALPGEFEIHVATSHIELWNNNPHVTAHAISPHVEIEGIQSVPIHYPNFSISNRVPGHFIEAVHQWFSKYMKVEVRPNCFHGDLYLSEEEKQWPKCLTGLLELGTKYWLICASSKRDFTCKMYSREHWQKLVDLIGWTLGSKVRVVQIGAANHDNWPLTGAIDLRGQTNLRDVISLTYWSEGCVSLVSFLAHLSAALPEKRPQFIPPDDKPQVSENQRTMPYIRPCVVIAGGREAASWEQYNGHQFLQTIGQLDCCGGGGCWRSRTTALLDGDPKDKDHLCLHPTKAGKMDVPLCMQLITPERVMESIMGWYRGGVLSIN